MSKVQTVFRGQHSIWKLLSVSVLFVLSQGVFAQFEEYSQWHGEGVYQVKNIGSGKCMDANSDTARADTGEGTSILQWDCHQGLNQMWSFQEDGDDVYRIISLGDPFLSVDVSASGGAGTNLIQWGYNGTNNQKFKVVKNAWTGGYNLIAQHDNSCLTIENSSRKWNHENGANIQNTECISANTYEAFELTFWEFTPIFTPISRSYMDYSQTPRSSDGCSVPDDFDGAVNDFFQKGLFLPACTAHDACYSAPWRRAGFDGDYGKNICDVQFLVDMESACVRAADAVTDFGDFLGTPFEFTACISVAEIMQKSVITAGVYGNSSYDDAQNSSAAKNATIY